MKLPKLKLKKLKISKAQFKTSWKRVPFLLCVAALIIAIVNMLWVLFFRDSYERMSIQSELVFVAVLLLDMPSLIQSTIETRRIRKNIKRLDIKMIVLETLLEVTEKMDTEPTKKTK